MRTLIFWLALPRDAVFCSNRDSAAPLSPVEGPLTPSEALHALPKEVRITPRARRQIMKTIAASPSPLFRWVVGWKGTQVELELCPVLNAPGGNA